MAGHASGYANNIFDRVGFATSKKKLESILMKFVNLVFSLHILVLLDTWVIFCTIKPTTPSVVAKGCNRMLFHVFG